MNLLKGILLFVLASFTLTSCSTKKTFVGLMDVGEGWSKTSVNATIFRKNSIVSNDRYQYIAYYDSVGNVIIGQREFGSEDWKLKVTPFTGNVNDAHNVISIMVDGDGYLHMAWDHHDHPLRYVKSIAPNSLEMSEKMSMVDNLEDVVSYPEFYSLPNGDLFFVYRRGMSGGGNIVLNRYHLSEKRWERVHDNLVSGEGDRNAYWQMSVDNVGVIHLSWVWRETWDVATNHDLCYAKSSDGGHTWTNSKGENLVMPITLATSEIIYPIAQNSNLINQTSITTDSRGFPAVASYWTEPGDSLTQFYVVWYSGKEWKVSQASRRAKPFSLSGGGTRRIPVSRPQLLSTFKNGQTRFFLIYRDEDAGNRIVISTAVASENMVWRDKIIEELYVGQWEPSFDTELWRKKDVLALYVQDVAQGAGGERSVETSPKMVRVLQLPYKQLKQIFE